MPTFVRDSFTVRSPWKQLFFNFRKLRKTRSHSLINYLLPVLRLPFGSPPLMKTVRLVHLQLPHARVVVVLSAVRSSLHWSLALRLEERTEQNIFGCPNKQPPLNKRTVQQQQLGVLIIITITGSLLLFSCELPPPRRT